MSQILKLSDYSNKSIVVRGKDANATRTRKEELKKLGGIYNPRLRTKNKNISPGWIFPTKDRIKLQNYIDSVNDSAVKKMKEAVLTNDSKKMKHKSRFIDTTDPHQAKKRRICKDNANIYSYLFWFLVVYSIFITTILPFLTASASTRIISTDFLHGSYIWTFFSSYINTEYVQNLSGQFRSYLTWVSNSSSNVL